MQGDVGLIPAWEAKIPYALWSKNQNKTWKHNIIIKSIQIWKMVRIQKKKNGGRVSLNSDWLIQSSSYPLNHVSWLWFPKIQQLWLLPPHPVLSSLFSSGCVFSCLGEGLLHNEFLLSEPRVVALGHHHSNMVMERFAPKIYSKAGEEMSGKKARVWRSFAICLESWIISKWQAVKKTSFLGA